MPDADIVVQQAPRLSVTEAEQLAARHYAVTGRAEPLPSERDQNFRITCPDGASFVLKVANATETEGVLDFQNAALAHLAGHAPSVAVPRVVAGTDGSGIGRIAHGGATHMIRLLTWLPGRVLAAVRPHTRELLEGLGRRLGEMDRGLEGFAHPSMRRPLAWDLERTPRARDELTLVASAERRALVERAIARFERDVRPRLPGLRRQVIHNDWNDHNVVVEPPGPLSRSRGEGWPGTVTGAVDFGDMIESWTVADLAVACCYAMLGKPDPVQAAAAIARGYHASLPLAADELDVLCDLIRARLVISVTMAARQSAQAPENAYLRVSEDQAWTLLAALDGISPSWAACAFRRACGLAASRKAPAVAGWLASHRGRFGPVVAHDLRRGPLAVLDLGVGSLDIPRPESVLDLEPFCALVDDAVRRAGAAIGIGRYDEARLVYTSDAFRYPANWDEENRTVHLGIDLFLPPGSEVRAPLDGVVHSVRNNRGTGDYGPTVILEHATDEGVPFYTLYGHLTLDSIVEPGATAPAPGTAPPGLSEGARVGRGDLVGRLGDPAVNGGWPPHLHFQVITDLLGRRGEFPGIAAPGERETWLELCPDPNLILDIPADRIPPRPAAGEEILAARRRHVGRNLSVSYRRPLAIVRGHMQFLFDACGRRYLDAVNNVPHVGHGHPRVVEAVARQLAVLNTNTRYLHPLLASYAGRLAALLPDPLSVCFIVCSGSEANELALRLAHAATGRRGLIVVDTAYHGNTTSLVEMSPYKFDGPGGGGRPAHVRQAVLPDVYRGPIKANAPRPGAQYARYVAEAVRELEASGLGVAAFFCESLPGCAGQLVLPDGYLAAAYEAVRAAGGVCVADEVQTGFGRVGSHLWGFETQGVVPDIVTLGKPIGNGYPLAAVVTRPEIADAFANGMEYFNTFGGSQAACAAGHAVLDVMRDEHLQERALAVGARLKAGLAGLADRFPIIGDVRGLGLFLGVELVTDRRTLQPAPLQADYVVNRVRDRGILLSTDGPLHNVLKIKPPLQFTGDDADRLVATLAGVLEEDGARPE